MNTKQLAISIGEAFRVARTARGLTAAQAAELLRLQPDFYGRVEDGHSFPTLLTCARAVEALGVDPITLFGEAVIDNPAAECRRAQHESLAAENELMRDLLAAAEDAAAEAAAHRDQLGAQAVLSVHDLTSERDAALARAESLAAECESLYVELGRVRAERDAAQEEGIEWARAFVGARDRIDAMEAERETSLLIAKLRHEDPDVTEHGSTGRVEFGLRLSHTPAGPIITARVEP